MNKILTIIVAAMLPMTAMAQPPAGYYDPAEGLAGQTLRAALSSIIRPHTSVSYTPGVWNAYNTTDKKASGKIWDIYSDIPGGTPAYEYTYMTDQCGSSSPTGEDDCYNREHTWPQSMWTFITDTPLKTDLFHVYPTDAYVNAQRDNNPYGKVGTATHTFTNGSRLGNNTYPGAPSGTCFEPIDSFKGDIARTYFYISTCYRNDSAMFNSWEMATLVALKPWAAQMLLEWHHLDPVSQKEINRNNAIYAIQHNRNPFIDRPEFADCIWGTGTCTTSTGNIVQAPKGVQVLPNPARGAVNITFSDVHNETSVRIYDIKGQLFYKSVNSPNNHVLHLDVNNWPRGMYILHITAPDNNEIQKLIVQ